MENQLGSPDPRDMWERMNTRAEMIASALLEDIGQTSFVSLTAVELKQRLLDFTKQSIEILRSEPYKPDAAHVVGESLVELGYWQPEVLDQVQSLLIQHLPVGLASKEQAFLYKRLILFLSHFATGFSRQMYDLVLKEQAQIQESLFRAKRQTEEKLRESTHRFETLVEATFEGVAIHKGGWILDVNPSLAKMFGYKKSELYGQSVLDLCTPEFHSLARHQIRGQATSSYEITGLRKDGTTFPIEVRGKQLCTAQGVFRIAAVRDLTMRKARGADLTRVRRQLVQSREAERLRLAHELHDGPIQDLLAISYRLAGLSKQTEDEDQELATLHQDVVTQVKKLRRLYKTMRPVALDELGLQEALRRLILKYEERDDFVTCFYVDGDITNLPDVVAMTIYRVVQEGLTNIAKHSRAERISVVLERRNHFIMGTVADDGQGFQNPERMSTFSEAEHFGLLGMIERVEVLGGQVNIHSQPGIGTEVYFWLPDTLDNGGGDG